MVRLKSSSPVTLNIAPVNDAPEVSDTITAAFDEDDLTLELDLLQNASDVDGDDLDVANVQLLTPSDRGR